MKYNNLILHRNPCALKKLFFISSFAILLIFIQTIAVRANLPVLKNTILKKHAIIEDEKKSMSLRSLAFWIVKRHNLTVTEEPFLFSDNDDRGLKISKLFSDVTGRVIDERGQGLVGATIKVKGTGNATKTDAQGKFQLKNIIEGTLLQVSFVSYQSQEINANSKTEMLIQLIPETGSLNEVVVSGYGQTQKKISVTASISSIQTKELKQSPVSNLSNALAGRLPGLTTIQSSGIPGSDASTLFIRGIGTYGANRSPLIVVDGLQKADANFGDIDVNEVASISILKDAAATSLYGIQGANGVILVTTKRGKIGKTNIQFNGQYGFQAPQRVPERFNSFQKALLDNQGATNDGNAAIWTENEIDLFRTQGDPYTYPDVNWYDIIFEPTTPQQQYNTNIVGGNSSVKYFVSLGYLNQGTLFRGANDNKYDIRQKYDRYNFRSNIDINATNMMKIRLDLASRIENRTGPGPGYSGVFNNVARMDNYTTPVFNPNGTYGAGRIIASDARNPLASIKDMGYYDNFFNSTNGTIEVSHQLDFITKGLIVKSLYSFENFGAINYSQTQNINSFRYKKDPVTGKETYTPFTTQSSLGKSSGTTATRYYNYNVQLNYDRSFGKSTIGGLALFNRNYTSVTGDLPKTYEGFVGRATYGYDGKYFGDFNMGYNGSENFPKGKRFGFFPSVSAGWIVSAEPWYSLKVMNYLKIRGSYGYVGNDNIGGARWLFISDYSRGGGFDFGAPPSGNQGGYNVNRTGNPNVTWERAAKADVSFETGFFDSQLKLDFGVFREIRRNILTTPQTVPTYLGIAGLSAINVGKVLNQGFEASLNFNTSINKVNVFGYVNWTYNKNKVITRDEPELAYPYQALTGLPVGYELGYIAEGLFKSPAEIDISAKQSFAGKVVPGDIRYRDMNGDMVINENDRVAIQTSNFPFNNFGASIGGSWKGIDISILFQGAISGKTNVPYLGPARLEDVWTPANSSIATYPIVHYSQAGALNNGQLSTFFVFRSDYLKLKNLELGYTFPKKLLERIKMNSLRVFVNGLNLATWDKLPYHDYDPEQIANGTALYPTMKVYNVGVSLNF